MAGPIGTKFGTRLRIRPGMDIGYIQFTLQYPGVISGGGGLGDHKFKSGKSAKRLDRLAQNFVHVCGFVW